MLICICNNLDEDQIKYQLIHTGCTKAGTCCGTCLPYVEEISKDAFTKFRNETEITLHKDDGTQTSLSLEDD